MIHVKSRSCSCHCVKVCKVYCMNLRWSRFAPAYHFFIVVISIIIIVEVCGRHSSDTSSGYIGLLIILIR